MLLAWYNIFKGLDLYVTSWTVGTQKVGTYHPNHENPNLFENIIQTVHNLRNLPEKFYALTFIFQASNVREFVSGKSALGFSLSKNAYRIVWKFSKDTALLM